MELLHATTVPSALLERVGALIDAGRCGAAGPLLAAARQVGGASPELSVLAARLAEGQGEIALARSEYDAAVEAAPDHADLRKRRSSFCHRLGDFERAARDAAEAVILDAADPGAKALLGSALLSLGRVPEARRCLAEASAAVPTDSAMREALAIATEADGDPDGAFAILRAGLSPEGGALNLRNAAILFCIRHQDFATGIALAEDGRRAGTVDACLFGLKGHAQSSLGLHTEAADSYAEALKLCPDDPYVRHLVAAGGLLPGVNRAPADYVRTVFDGYAPRFEAHLISLGYRVPGAMRRVVLEYLDSTGEIGSVLDLGCGTGLMGVAIGDLPMGTLTGVDVSGRMLEEAAAKGIYTALHEADAVAWLGEAQETFSLILAADMVCYFGALESLLSAVAPRLDANGWFVFSVEASSGAEDWTLQRQGRFVHAKSYVRDALRGAGMALRSIHKQVIRSEAGVPVNGYLIVAQPALALH
jgi:predicted TPR repeat methyltransferase